MPDYKIAFVDIETAPNLGYTWGKYEQTVLAYKQERYMLSFAVRWAGSENVEVHALPDWARFDKDKTDDRDLVAELWHVLNDADLIVAHNGDRFDLRVTNARFLAHGFPPPEPYKTVDTLKLARRNFFLNSNKLDDIAAMLGLGRKLEVGGIALWLACMAGDEAAWDKMKEYNKHDVVLLEAVYERLKPWHVSHPNIAIKQSDIACPVCASKDVQKRGYGYLVTYRVQRYQCKACGHWSKGKSERLQGTHLK
jgi:DNA polymerase elongation subunit (family B)